MAMTADRSLTDVVVNIIGNIQEIIRSEIRLAKTEIREEARKTKAPAMLLGVGFFTALFAILFLLLGLAAVLATVVPVWASALIVGSALTVAAIILLRMGLLRCRHLKPKLHRTVETIKENVEWAKQRAR